MREKIEELLQDESIINEYGVKLHFIGNLQLLAEPVRISMEKAMKVTAHNKQRVLLVCVAYTSSDEIVHAVQESCKEMWNEVQNSNGVTVSNGTIGQLDRSLKRNGIRVNAQDSCKDCTRSDANGSTDRSREAETSSCCGMVEIAEEGKHDQGKVPAIKLTDVEKNMYMSVAPDPDILIRTSGEARLSNFLLWQTSTCPLYSPAALWPEIGLRHLIWAVLNFQRHHFYLEKKKKQF
ncbi:hypothetical protein PIB30_052969 [Stylosanthes scabra]|uniref:Alkyl transferase n=1 Tax=Stylosanthes scabra TaxID=79078 RepID=A0ABU6SII5_9FABA|nr:hypothetical protein [Stylosanthes scabra]